MAETLTDHLPWWFSLRLPKRPEICTISTGGVRRSSGWRRREGRRRLSRVVGRQSLRWRGKRIICVYVFFSYSTCLFLSFGLNVFLSYSFKCRFVSSERRRWAAKGTSFVKNDIDRTTLKEECRSNKRLVVEKQATCRLKTNDFKIWSFVILALLLVISK